MGLLHVACCYGARKPTGGKNEGAANLAFSDSVMVASSEDVEIHRLRIRKTRITADQNERARARSSTKKRRGKSGKRMERGASSVSPARRDQTPQKARSRVKSLEKHWKGLSPLVDINESLQSAKTRRRHNSFAQPQRIAQPIQIRYEPGKIGLSYDRDGVVKKVMPMGQSETRGVKKDWKIVRVGQRDAHSGKEIHARIKYLSDLGESFEVIFEPPLTVSDSVVDILPVPRPKVEAQSVESPAASERKYPTEDHEDAERDSKFEARLNLSENDKESGIKGAKDEEKRLSGYGLRSISDAIKCSGDQKTCNCKECTNSRAGLFEVVDCEINFTASKTTLTTLSTH